MNKPSIDTVIHFDLYFFLISLCFQQIRGKIRRTGRIFPEHVERSFLDPEYSFVADRRIPRTRFAKQRFLPVKNQLYSPNFFQVRRITRSMFVKQMFARLKTGFGLVSRRTSVQFRFGSSLSSKVVVCGHCPVTLSLTIKETLKRPSSLPTLMQKSFWWW